MNEISAIGLFCEDIREEKSGSLSLIGVLGDTLAVPDFPGAMPKIGTYVRINLSTEIIINEFNINLKIDENNIVNITKISKDLINKSIYDTKALGNNISGIYSHTIFSPFPVNKPGRIILMLNWDGGEIILGSLNFIKAENAEDVETVTISPTA